MAYNNGRENRKWLIWKEAEEKKLPKHGVDENTIEQIRTDDRADFNSNLPKILTWVQPLWYSEILVREFGRLKMK